jgi:hypothetical protein
MYQAGANCTIYLNGVNTGIYDTAVQNPNQQGPKILFESSGLESGQQHTLIIEVDVTSGGWVSPVPNQSSAILYIDSIK